MQEWAENALLMQHGKREKSLRLFRVVVVVWLPQCSLLVDCSSTKIKKRVIDINHFHVSLVHVHSSVLKATDQQYGIQLVGELAPCSGYSMAKGIRAPTPHRTTSRAEAPLDLVHIDTAGPFPESLGGSRYVVMFVDSASRFQRPYGTRDKSASAILGVV